MHQNVRREQNVRSPSQTDMSTRATSHSFTLPEIYSILHFLALNNWQIWSGFQSAGVAVFHHSYGNTMQTEKGRSLRCQAGHESVQFHFSFYSKENKENREF